MNAESQESQKNATDDAGEFGDPRDDKPAHGSDQVQRERNRLKTRASTQDPLIWNEALKTHGQTDGPPGCVNMPSGPGGAQAMDNNPLEGVSHGNKRKAPDNMEDARQGTDGAEGVASEMKGLSIKRPKPKLITINGKWPQAFYEPRQWRRVTKAEDRQPITNSQSSSYQDQQEPFGMAKQERFGKDTEFPQAWSKGAVEEGMNALTLRDTGVSSAEGGFVKERGVREGVDEWRGEEG
ncbi:MAG: hypothetical protein M1814_003324 [Vezdaea aestivalis]|nr:MAG: hypothetical protein M1814_003324 [Vezdaea aestivalis]